MFSSWGMLCLSSAYKQLGSVIWPSLGSFLSHGVLWECVKVKFWIQGVALAILMLFQRCFCWDWIVIGCGQGFSCEKLPYPEYFFYLMLSDISHLECVCWSLAKHVCDIFSCTWRNGWWCVTLLFGKFALFYQHQSCQCKFKSYMNCYLADYSLKQQSAHVIFLNPFIKE